MSVRSGCCCINSDSCLVGNNRRRSGQYYGVIRPLAFFVVTTLLAMTVSHVCDKFSSNSSLRVIKSDLMNLRKHLSTLSVEVQNIVDMRDELKGKMREVNVIIPKISDAIRQLRDEVSEDSGPHSAETMRDVVKNELRVYDAEKIGDPDYALQTLGGSIVTTRDTESYDKGLKSLSVFGAFLCPSPNRPEIAIQAGVLPGQCWSFKGSKGSLVIKLIGRVFVSSVSLEHITPEMSPTRQTTSAPRDFSVWGLQSTDDDNGFLLGEFKYDNSAGPVQNFPVQHETDESFELIEVKFLTNSGNSEYTCVYRIRVHGTLNE